MTNRLSRELFKNPIRYDGTRLHFCPVHGWEACNMLPRDRAHGCGPGRAVGFNWPVRTIIASKPGEK